MVLADEEQTKDIRILILRSLIYYVEDFSAIENRKRIRSESEGRGQRRSERTIREKEREEIAQSQSLTPKSAMQIPSNEDEEEEEGRRRKGTVEKEGGCLSRKLTRLELHRIATIDLRCCRCPCLELH